MGAQKTYTIRRVKVNNVQKRKKKVDKIKKKTVKKYDQVKGDP